MNKTTVKVIVASVISFFGGGAVGYFLRKKYDEDNCFEVISEEEMKAIEDGLGEAKLDEAKPNNVVPMEAFKTSSSIDGIEKQKPNTTKEDYAKMWKAGKAVETYSTTENADRMMDLSEGMELTIDDLDEAEKAVQQDIANEKAPPHEISTSDFYTRNPGHNGYFYNKETLYWYEDGVVCSEDENRVEDWESLIGYDIAERFSKVKIDPDGDPDVIFMRNDRYETDYEVIRLHKNYWDGIKEDG